MHAYDTPASKTGVRHSGGACEAVMDFSTNEDHEAIRKGVASVVARFDDAYWLQRDDDGEFPREFHRAMAEGGWLGLTMPEEFGGAGLGVTEAMVMMHEIASHG